MASRGWKGLTGHAVEYPHFLLNSRYDHIGVFGIRT